MLLQALDAPPAMTLTEKMFLDIEKRNQEGQAGGAGGTTTIAGLFLALFCCSRFKWHVHTWTVGSHRV